MSAKKSKEHLSKVCRIYQWIESKDEEFAGAIRQVCMEGALTPRLSGVTFLYPLDAKFREEICNNASGDGDGDEAVKQISSLIIPLVLPNASAFLGKKIGSAGRVLFDVEQASGDTVKLKGGAVLTPAKDFQLLQSAKHTNVAVWLLKEGRPPTAGEAYVPSRGREAEGGAIERRLGAFDSARAKLARKVEDEFDACMAKDGCAEKDPYLVASVSLLNFLKANHPDLCALVCGFLDWNPIVQFYLMVEPYKVAGAPILPEGVLFGASGWNGAELYEDAVAEYRRFFAELASCGSAAAFTAHDKIMNAVDQVRLEATKQGAGKAAPAAAVMAAYTALEQKNSIGGVSNVFPERLAAAYRASPGKKLWQDEFRYVVHFATKDLYSAARSAPGSYSKADWLEALAVIYSRPGDAPQKEVHMVSNLLMKGNVSPQADFYELLGFANSTDLLYTPPPLAMTGGYTGRGDDPYDGGITNRNHEARCLVEGGRSRRATGVSPAALTELRMYMARHGGDLSGLGLK